MVVDGTGESPSGLTSAVEGAEQRPIYHAAFGDRQSVCRRGLEGDAVGALRRATTGDGRGFARGRRRSCGSRCGCRQPDGADRLIEVTVAAYRGIDILVNNVGVAGWRALPTAAMTTGAASPR